jgi:hydroxyacylglutathione hydrolase
MTVRVVPLPLSISNSYLLLGDRPVLLDAGMPGEEERLISALGQNGIAPTDISLVVLTHGHTDHVGSVNALARAGVPIAIGEEDADILESGANGPLPITSLKMRERPLAAVGSSRSAQCPQSLVVLRYPT